MKNIKRYGNKTSHFVISTIIHIALILLVFLMVTSHCRAAISSKAKPPCLICSRDSLVHYYAKQDMICVLNLMNGQLTPIRTRQKKMGGKSSSVINSMPYGTVYTTTEEGLCRLEIFWDNVTFSSDLELSYCSTCISKIKTMEFEQDISSRNCPFVLIDCKNLELYDFKHITTEFISDYYFEINQLEENRLKGIITYMQKRMIIRSFLD